MHRIFLGGGQKILGGTRVGDHFPLSKTSVENWHFLPLLPEKLLKFPPNEVKNRNRTGEQSEPRNFLEYECSKPIFGAHFYIDESIRVQGGGGGEGDPKREGGSFKGGGQARVARPLDPPQTWGMPQTLATVFGSDES